MKYSNMQNCSPSSSNKDIKMARHTQILISSPKTRVEMY